MSGGVQVKHVYAEDGGLKERERERGGVRSQEPLEEALYRVPGQKFEYMPRRLPNHYRVLYASYDMQDGVMGKRQPRFPNLETVLHEQLFKPRVNAK